MREILFRGKRADNGEWIYGDLLHNICTTKIREKETDIERIAKSYSVIPDTVGQYTGLKDKNGKKIFEGDRVLFFHNNEAVKGTINYLSDRFFIACGMWAGDLNRFATTGNLWIEAIGNIWEVEE